MRKVNIKNIEDKNIFLAQINRRYDNIISNEIGILIDKKLKEAIHVTAKIAIINYVCEIKEKKFEFINKKIKKLDKRIIPLIFTEIIKLCFKKEDKEETEEEEDQEMDEIDEYKNFDKMKTFIFEEFSNKLDNINDIDNIIYLIDCLEGKDKKNEKEDINIKKEKDKEKEKIIKEFLEKLMTKYLFTKNEYFSGNQSLKIVLFDKLYKKGKIQKNEEEEYYLKIEELQ